MKVKIEIKHYLTGAVLFEYESENNTIKETLERAVAGDANLRGANLGGANLGDANLGDANLGGANLRGAYLRDANLGGANLRDANLRGANLGGANLRDANLRDAYLRDANLGGAYLDDANLGGAYLGGANLGGAKDADIAIAMTRILPEGSIIGWKKGRDDRIIKLRIPEEAKRSHAFGRKCRAEYAEVLEITKGNRQLKNAMSNYDESFIYKVGEIVRPVKPFSENWQEECESGIHFFITKLEAENYDY